MHFVLQIKLAMRSEGSCIRRYEPDVSKAAHNSISLFFKTNRTSNNLNLAFLGHGDAEDFMSLEIVNERVRFAWDIG